MRRRAMMVLAGMVGVVLIAGCTMTNPGHADQAPPAASTETTTASTQSASSEPSGGPLPSDGAPKVKNPLDTSRYQQDPCLALTAGQAQELKVPSRGVPTEVPLGVACQWRNPDTRGLVQIRFLDEEHQRGISASYAANRAGRWAYFVMLPEIEGFPAVAADRVDDRENGSCTVDVGVSDAVAFSVPLQLSQANVGQKDPCEVAVQVAGMMLRTMKAGG